MKQWGPELSAAVQQLWQTALAYLPRVAAALVLLVCGWLAARLLRLVAFRLLRRLSRFGAVERELKDSGADEVTARILATGIFWIVFVLFIAAAGQTLGLAVITGGLSRLAGFLPNVLAAVLILVAGLVGGNLTRTAIGAGARSARIPQADLLANGARLGVLTVSAVIAIEQVGANSTVLVVALGLILGGGIGGAALAFGLGSREAVANLIASHYLVQVYRRGQRVRIGGIEGEISAFTRGGVRIETEDGRALVPAKLFEESASVLLDEESR